MKTLLSAVVGGLSKYLTAVLAGLLLAAALATGLIYKQLDAARVEAAVARETATQYQALADSRKASLAAAETAHKAVVKSLSTRAAKAEAQAKLYKEKSNALESALADNRGWSDSPIPDGVASALRGR